MKEVLENRLLHIAWVISLAAVLGSLYFSEVLKLAPCVLCWYQRILMYPLVIIIPIGIVSMDKKVYKYVLPLTILGMTVAFYHYLLYVGIIPESLAPCSNGVSCTQKLIEWFGFINIPLLSFLSFTFMTLLMIIHIKNTKNE